MSKVHQLVASTLEPSGVTATYLGTAPVGITWLIFQDSVSMRYRKLGGVPSEGLHSSDPSRKPGPYIE